MGEARSVEERRILDWQARRVALHAGQSRNGRQGGVWNGFARKGSEWQAWKVRERPVVAHLVELSSGRHGGARKFQVSRGTKRSVPVRQARLVRAIEDSYGESRLGRAGTEPERRKHFGLSIQITWIVPGQCTDRW